MIKKFLTSAGLFALCVFSGFCLDVLKAIYPPWWFGFPMAVVLMVTFAVSFFGVFVVWVWDIKRV